MKTGPRDRAPAGLSVARHGHPPSSRRGVPLLCPPFELVLCSAVLSFLGELTRRRAARERSAVSGSQ